LPKASKAPNHDQRLVYYAIRALIKRQYPLLPNVEEIAAEAGLKWGTTHNHLKALRSMGYVNWIDNKPRTIHITKRLPRQRSGR
jgi:DNA-binding MarR family transcriptional regulator